MSDRDRMVLEGRVIAANRGSLFTVELDNNIKVSAKPSGKIQKNLIKILVGDTVTVEVSPFDTTKGRILYRTA